jgi:hypothetical protein
MGFVVMDGSVERSGAGPGESAYVVSHALEVLPFQMGQESTITGEDQVVGELSQ